MNEMEALDLMQSDMKLWDSAQTKNHKDGRVTKTLHLPWGIGELAVTLEGMDDATKRRAAVGQFAAYVRAEIKERTDDEAVTARAQTAAARHQSDDSPDGFGIDPNAGLLYTTGEAEAVQATGEAHEDPFDDNADFRAGLIARGASLRRVIDRQQGHITRWKQELKGVEAALKAMGLIDE